MAVNRLIIWPWFIIILLIASAIWLQMHIFIVGDVSWLLHAADSMLHGGHYNIDFFETNPPLILYLNMLPVFVSNHFHSSLITDFRIYIFTIAILIIMASNYLLKKIFSQTDAHIRYCLVIAITFSLLLLPVAEFGQREHIMAILTLPYLLIIVLRAMHRPIQWQIATFFGVLAGIGFALKPYFLITPLLIELYLLTTHKTFRAKISSCWRAENIAIGIVLIAYVVSIWLFTPEYIHQTLPIVVDFYFSGLPIPLWQMIFLPPFVGWLLLVCCYAIGKEQQAHEEFDRIFFIAATGFLLCFIMQRAPWYYHWLPSLILTTILLVKFIANNYYRIAKNPTTWEQACRIAQTIIACVILVGFSGYMFASQAAKRVSSVYAATDYLNKAIAIVQQYSRGGSIYFLYSFDSGAYPLVDYAHTTSASRFPGLIFLTGLAKYSNFSTNPRATQEKQFLLKAAVDDFYLHHPTLVFVDSAAWAGYYDNKPFDYLHYFAQVPRFSAAFKCYHYLTQCNNFKVYQKISTCTF